MTSLQLERKDGGRSDPLLPSSSSEVSFWRKWWNESAWPGMGLFGESYLLFSIGTLRPIWERLFPECFLYEETCSSSLLKSLTYSVVLGVIVGMLVVGTLANTMGRRAGSITTASLMCFGSCGLLLASLLLNNAPVLVLCMSILLFIFGIGVGGEYPLSASSASERAMGIMKRKMALELEREEQGLSQKDIGPTVVAVDRQHQQQEMPPPIEELFREEEQEESFGRGKRVQLVFTMQGMGIFVNTIVLTVLLWFATLFGNYENDDYSSSSLLSIWRITYAVGAMILSLVLTSRIQYLTESLVWQDDKQRREQIKREEMLSEKQQQTVPHNNSSKQQSFGEMSSLSGHSQFPPTPWSELSSLKHCPSTSTEEDLKASPTALLFRNYGWRLFGTSTSWLLWDIAFYGNKLFQSSFLLALTGDETTLLELSGALALNALVALLGYICAAHLVDHPSVGRVKLQQWGFLLTGTLFCCCGVFSDKLSSAWLVCFYLGSSFFGQCGPNATTFLIPAEVFPTEMRTMCHGIAAASGKVGALVAAVVFSHISDTRHLFFWSGYSSFVACVITYLTIPDTTTLDLYEIDRKWRMTLAGKKGEYEGDANNPKYLSLYERQKLGL